MAASITKLIDEYAIYLENSDLAESTVDTYKTSLNQFRKWLEHSPDIPQTAKEIKAKHIEAFFYHRKQQGCGNGTRQQNYIHLNLFFEWIHARYRKQCKKNPLKKVNRIPYKLPHREFPERDILDKIIQSFDATTFEGMRNRFAFTVLKETGIRADELIQLEERDFDTINQVLTIRNGKGGKSRRVPFPEIVTIEFLNYLALRNEHTNRHRRRLLITRQGELTYQTLLGTLTLQCKLLNIKHTTPHLFRHAFADFLKEEGFSDDAIMEIMGWDTRTMLDHYARAKRKDRAIAEYRRKMSKEE